MVTFHALIRKINMKRFCSFGALAVIAVGFGVYWWWKRRHPPGGGEYSFNTYREVILSSLLVICTFVGGTQLLNNKFQIGSLFINFKRKFEPKPGFKLGPPDL